MSREKAANKSREPRLNRADQELLISCGIDPDKVNPALLGRGINHRVYKLKEESRVVKIPTRNRLGVVREPSQEKNDIEVCREYFSEFFIPTTLLQSDLGYCITMDYVEGRPLTTTDVFERNSPRRGKKRLSPLGDELTKLVDANNILMQETGKMIDLIGFDGFLDTIGGSKLGGRPARLANVLVVDNKLRLIDYDLIPINDSNISMLARAKARGVNSFNRYSLSRQFQQNPSNQK